MQIDDILAATKSLITKNRKGHDQLPHNDPD